MRAFIRELVQALRVLRKAPGFTLVAMLTLALGIGATLALFSLSRALLMENLLYPEAERLFAVHQSGSGERGTAAHQAIGRLAPGATAAAAGKDMRRMAAREPEANPDSNRGLGAGAAPLRQTLAEDGRNPLLFLLGAMGLLLLIACANIAKFFLVRALAEERALGASRRASLGKFLAEALVVIGGGILLGLFLAYGLLRVLGPFMLQEVPPSLMAAGLSLFLPVSRTEGGALSQLSAAMRVFHDESPAGSPPRLPGPAQVAGLRPRRSADAGPRHRSEHRHVQLGGPDAASRPAFSEAGALGGGERAQG